MEYLKVLVVDDEPGMRRGAVKTLRKFTVNLLSFDKEVGFEIDETENGRSTLEALEQNQYDIVLLDYKLPDISGLDILDKINKNGYDLLTIMMTAYASLEVAISATKNGASDFLAKPFTPDELRAVIQKSSTNLLLERHARQLEEEKKQVRFQFLSVLSHELKAPLNAIEGYLRILDDKVAGDDIANYEKMVSRSLVRIGGMRKLIFDMLDLTRIESGQKVREIAELNIVEALTKSIETIEPAAKERNITIAVDSASEVRINGDMSELEIMFNNLLSNAVKYNRESGSINVTIKQDGNIINISVADTGIGMNETEMSKLFKEFVRFKNEKTRNIEGSGLGLSILKRLTSMYDGGVWAESKPDVGTTFHLKLKNRPIKVPEENE